MNGNVDIRIIYLHGQRVTWVCGEKIQKTVDLQNQRDKKKSVCIIYEHAHEAQ